MKSKTTRGRLLASSMICGAALAGVSATQAAAQAGGQAQVQEIVVTGSRIPTPNLTSVSPVTAVTSQELKLQGTTNVENMLNSLPQVNGSLTGAASNGATGTATVDLRGLGPVRTLVLIDGRRLMPGDPTFPVADLNAIPSGLVQRIDVLTGGASAVYGADAVAGVVNFVMQRDFEGFRIDGEYSFAQHRNDNSHAQELIRDAFFPVDTPKRNLRDGETTDISLMLGVNAPDGRGNITAYAGYRHVEPVLQAARDYSSCAVLTTYASDPSLYDTQICLGSSNNAFGRFRNDNVGGGGVSVNPDGSQSFVDFSPAFSFNFNPLNYFQRPDDRYTAGYFAHYSVNDSLELYSDLMLADDHTLAQIAPSGLFQGTGPNGTSTFGINCDNPLMTLAQQQTICGATNAGTPFIQQTTIGFRFAGLPRQDDLRHTAYRITLGARGDLGENWHYDVYGLYGTSVYNEHYNNDVSTRKVQNALLVDPATGQCAGGSTDGCVPLNLFQLGGLTPDAVAYVLAKGFKSGDNTERVVDASVTGDLGAYGIKMPWATDGVGVALGAEYRREGLNLIVDEEFATGDLSGQGGPTLSNSGAYDVYELFGEARVPLVQDLPFFKDLNLELGYRYSDYSTAVGTTNTYKVGFDWTPVEDIKVRASYNRAVRAPNVTELFTPSSIGLFSGADPCAGGSPAASLEACQRSGVTAAQYGNIIQCPAAQCSALFGGNANLEAEEADTYTAGVVLRPKFLPGFDLTVDYFDIKVANLISAFPALTLTDCLVNGNLGACSQFNRDPATGGIFGLSGFIDAVNINTGFLKTDGVDVQANYRTKFSDWGLGEWGGLAFNFVGTWTDKYEMQPFSGGDTFDCAGLFGVVCSAVAAGGPIPEWRHKLRVTWTTPWPVTVSANWRYISSVDFDVNQSNPFLHDPFGRTDTADATIKSYNYLDLSGTWKVRDTITMRVGVNNVFDKDPPILDQLGFPASGPPVGNGNTYPGTYDSLGRLIFVGLTADF